MKEVQPIRDGKIDAMKLNYEGVNPITGTFFCSFWGTKYRPSYI